MVTTGTLAFGSRLLPDCNREKSEHHRIERKNPSRFVYQPVNNPLDIDNSAIFDLSASLRPFCLSQSNRGLRVHPVVQPVQSRLCFGLHTGLNFRDRFYCSLDLVLRRVRLIASVSLPERGAQLPKPFVAAVAKRTKDKKSRFLEI